jgi:hypothetical protein
MKKILLFLILMSLFLVDVRAEETVGPDLVIDSVKINPFPVEPGKKFDVSLELRNTHTRKTIEDLRFNIQEAAPFSNVGELVKKIDSVKPNGKIVVDFTIQVSENAISGINELRMDYYNEDDQLRYTIDPINIDVRGTARDLSIISVKTLPEKIKPGDDVEVIVTLKNTVPVLMKNIDVNFDLGADDEVFTPIGSTTKRDVISLGKGASIDLIFNLAVDNAADPKVHKIPLTIDYEDEFGNEYSVDTLTGIKVETEPELRYSIDDSEVKTFGTSGKVIVKIVNSGLADIKFLTLELMESEDYKIISVPEVYLGNLESDDYETAEFTVFANTKEKEMPLKLRVSYRDAFNKIYHLEENLQLTLYSPTELKNLGINGEKGFASIIVYIVLIMFVYWFVVEWKINRNIPTALKLTLKRFLVLFKRFIKSIRLKTLKRAIVAIIRFIREP